MSHEEMTAQIKESNPFRKLNKQKSPRVTGNANKSPLQTLKESNRHKTPTKILNTDLDSVNSRKLGYSSHSRQNSGQK